MTHVSLDTYVYCILVAYQLIGDPYKPPEVVEECFEAIESVCRQLSLDRKALDAAYSLAGSEGLTSFVRSHAVLG